MIWQYRNRILLVIVVLTGLVLAGFWFIPAAAPPQKIWHQPVEPISGGEPITPIPLVLNLDTNKIALGSRLFMDARLSGDNTISCAHCHDLTRGGVDGLPHSFGIGGAEGVINTPSVFNSGFNFRQFWDGRAATLEDQIDGPLNNPQEMGTNWPDVIAKLSADAAYRRDFAQLYPAGIKPETIKDAIATFERSLTTPNAKFDRFLRGEKNALDGDEFAGYALFKKLGCISCHQGVNVGGNLYEKLGLFDNYFERRGNVTKADLGRYNVTLNEENRYEFRVPSLRNVTLTAPYFHDASASTLEEAVAIMAKYQLGVTLQGDEIAKIVKFLKALTGEYAGNAAGASGK
ncbi:MAG: cytochrome-c peroxidase [Gallionella sp.]|jgi:cytochrome c peroxidase